MIGQRRLAISRLRIPNLDGFVIATAGNLLSIGTPRHRVNTVFVRSQCTNPQKPGGKLGGKTYKYECPVSGHSQTYIFISFKLLSFSIIHLSNKSTFSSGRSYQHSQKEQDFPGYFPSMLRRKNLTPLSGRSGSTGNLEIDSPKS